MAGGTSKRIGTAKLFSLLSLALLASSLALLPGPASASPGWEIVLDRPTPNFGAIDFVSDAEGWLVAGAGLLHTTDGGATWREAAPLTGIDVDFADPEHGWLVGYNGTIYYTRDGGETWAAQDSGTDVHLEDVFAVSASEAWAVGRGRGFSDAIVYPVPTALLHTVDGGASWQRVEPPPDSWFHEITFAGQEGWALGTRCLRSPDPYPCGGTAGAVLHSSDRGETWSLVDLQLPDHPHDMQFLDPSHGWFVTEVCPGPGICERELFRTNDGGQTWERSDLSPYGWINGLVFQDQRTGWAVTESFRPEGYLLQLLKTSDGGVTWQQEISLPRLYVSDLFVMADTLYLTGRGIMLRSTDGGASWQDVSTPAIELRSFDFVDAEVGYAVSLGRLIRTGDGGRSWETLGPPDLSSGALLRFIDREKGFAVDPYQDDDCVLTIRQTADGGRRWSTAATFTGECNYPISLQFADEMHGWLAAYRGFFTTSDGGNTWEEHPLGDLGEFVVAAALADGTHAWAIVQASIDGGYRFDLIRSNDGGRSWKLVPGRSSDSRLDQIDFLDAEHGWYNGAVCDESFCRWALFATEGGGESWQEVAPDIGYVQDMAFVDAHNGWLSRQQCGEMGCTGQLLRTTDGGRTWKTELSGELLIGQFDFVDDGTGWFRLLPDRGKGIGGGVPQRTVLYRLASGGPKLPDVGAGPGGRSSGFALLLLATAGAVAFAAALVARRARRYSPKSPS